MHIDRDVRSGIDPTLSLALWVWLYVPGAIAHGPLRTGENDRG
ncbi:hypothetical protein [Natrinema salaciae]|uniref:Uncharacterized protein n=1 Tax=Natrinema salaciae TaxID=1186196 RepID=A0A1H9SPB6_9EURY|nr:hypothetical protein [Natrinema salaciae]SER86852.1 hypothetical protein SAMN04489841_4754 [Natrinema salaciae]